MIARTWSWSQYNVLQENMAVMVSINVLLVENMNQRSQLELNVPRKLEDCVHRFIAKQHRFPCLLMIGTNSECWLAQLKKTEIKPRTIYEALDSEINLHIYNA